MNEITGNLWDYQLDTNLIVITTNGTVKNNGACVMGRGCAQEAKERYPELPEILGGLIRAYGNRCFLLPHRIISFPVKYNWYDKADINLIINSAWYLRELVRDLDFEDIIIPRPGCGCGQLLWEDVKPAIKDILHHSWFRVIDK